MPLFGFENRRATGERGNRCAVNLFSVTAVCHSRVFLVRRKRPFFVRIQDIPFFLCHGVAFTSLLTHNNLLTVINAAVTGRFTGACILRELGCVCVFYP